MPQQEDLCLVWPLFRHQETDVDDIVHKHRKVHDKNRDRKADT
jgi:hypothetical protein